MIAWKSLTNSKTSDYENEETTTSSYLTAYDLILIKNECINERIRKQIEEFRDAIELAKYYHKLEMKEDQKNWWFSGIHKKVYLYRRYFMKPLTKYKILRCNRKGIGLKRRVKCR